MKFGSTPPINDRDLADVKEFACTGRAVPAVIVSAIIARLENAERTVDGDLDPSVGLWPAASAQAL